MQYFHKTPFIIIIQRQKGNRYNLDNSNNVSLALCIRVQHTFQPATNLSLTIWSPTLCVKYTGTTFRNGWGLPGQGRCQKAILVYTHCPRSTLPYPVLSRQTRSIVLKSGRKTLSNHSINQYYDGFHILFLTAAVE